MNRLRLDIEIPDGYEEHLRFQNHLKVLLENYGVRYDITVFNEMMIGVDPGMHSQSTQVQILSERLLKIELPPEDFIEEKEMKI